MLLLCQNHFVVCAELFITGLSSGAFYADLSSGCQVFHRCISAFGIVFRYSFLCPHGTVFNTESNTCDWWYRVQCNTGNHQDRDHHRGGQVQEHLGGAWTHNNGQSVILGQNKIEENHISYDEGDHFQGGHIRQHLNNGGGALKHNIGQSNSFAHDEKEENIIPYDYRPTSQNIYDFESSQGKAH